MAEGSDLPQVATNQAEASEAATQYCLFCFDEFDEGFRVVAEVRGSCVFFDGCPHVDFELKRVM